MMPAPAAIRRKSTAPRLECLETRELLAARAVPQVAITEVTDGRSASYDLVIVGTRRNDAITIVDDGQAGAGAIRVSTGRGADYVAQHPIANIRVITGAGRDAVTYQLPCGLQAGVQRSVTMSSAGFTTPTAPTISGGGSLRANVDVAGAIPAGSSLDVIATVAPKAATRLDVRQSGTVDGAFTVSATNQGQFMPARTGPVTFNLDSTAAIGATGRETVIAGGGRSRNLLSVNYSGTNDGALRVTEQGAGANDRVAANLLMAAGSTGTVAGSAATIGGTAPAQVGSTGKNARVRFAIFRGTDSTSTAGIDAQVTASARRSRIEHTANVQNLASGTATILS